ncbi:hypothetical protein GJ496_011201 [Pomphorhynchus laevis]|nr:hypothetical protein GJ496_011201 [Pomphorhynchus laevis]
MCLRIKGKPEVVIVELLDFRSFSMTFTRSQKAQDLFDSVFSYLSLEETDYFGLSFNGFDGLQQWLEPEKILLSQLASKTNKNDDEIKHKVQFRVRFYASDPTSPDHELTRYIFYLQVKQDIYTGRLKIPERKASSLFGYILQAELGDFDSKRDTIGYASEFHLLPYQTEQLELAATKRHMSLQGTSHSRAEMQVLNRVKWLDTYGLESYSVRSTDNRRYRFGFTPTGIIVYKKDLVICEYFWPRLRRCSYKQESIYIHVLSDKDNTTITKSYRFLTERRAKLTWKQCSKYRSFFQSKLSENIIKKERRMLDSSWASVYSASRMASFNESISSVPTFEPPVERVQSQRRARRSYSVDVTEYSQDQQPDDRNGNYNYVIAESQSQNKSDKKFSQHRSGKHHNSKNKPGKLSDPFSNGVQSSRAEYIRKNSTISRLISINNCNDQRRSRILDVNV